MNAVQVKKRTHCTTVGRNPEHRAESLPKSGRVGNLDALSNGRVEDVELGYDMHQTVE